MRDVGADLIYKYWHVSFQTVLGSFKTVKGQKLSEISAVFKSVLWKRELNAYKPINLELQATSLAIQPILEIEVTFVRGPF